MSATRQSSYDQGHGAPLEANRRGAHRARPNPLLSLLPFVAVAAVVLGVTAGAYFMFGDTSLNGGSNQVGSVVPSASSPASTPSATAEPTPTEAEPSETATPTPSEAEPSATVNKDAELVVLNGTSTGGLGARVASELKQDGWQVPDEASDFPNKPVSETTVYFAKKSERATARAVADALGSGYAVKRDASVADAGITVVIGTDYQA